MPELKLIDKTAAYRALKHEAETHELSFSSEAYGRAARIIDQMPTIEAEPVRHGRWILCEDQHGVDNDNNNYAYFCSQCHYQDVHSKYAKVNFCWNCGARMDETELPEKE